MSTSRLWKLWCCLCLVGGVTLIAPHLEKEDNQTEALIHYLDYMTVGKTGKLIGVESVKWTAGTNFSQSKHVLESQIPFI